MDELFEVQVERAFKRLKVSPKPVKKTVNNNETSTCLRKSPFLPTRNISSAAPNVFGRCSRPLTRPEHNIFARTRHSSCPERVAIQDDTTSTTTTNNGNVQARSQSPTTLHSSRTSPEVGNQTNSRLMDGLSSCDAASHECCVCCNVNSSKQQVVGACAVVDSNQRRRTRGLKRATTTTCSNQARHLDNDNNVDMSVDELAGYFDEQVHIPRKMSFMAELMYT